MESQPTPIFVVGNPRTGSTALMSLLGQHPEVRAYGELFHPDQEQRSTAHAVRDGETHEWYQVDEDPVDFLNRTVFNDDWHHGSVPKYVAIKVFAEHVNGPKMGGLFRRFEAHYPAARWVHMSRPFYPDVLISREVAQRTGEWVSWTGAGSLVPTPIDFEVPLDKARAFFETMAINDAFLRQLGPEGQRFRVSYDDLVLRPEQLWVRLQDFLSLHRVEAQPKTVIQRHSNNLHCANRSELEEVYRKVVAWPPRRVGNGDLLQADAVGEIQFNLDFSPSAQVKASVGNRFVMMKGESMLKAYSELADRLSVQTMVEIGIRHGGSVAWNNMIFRPDLHIAFDISPQRIEALDEYAHSRSHLTNLVTHYAVDQADSEQLLGLVKSAAAGMNSAAPDLDLVIDDASHELTATLRSFEALFPLVRVGGFYVIEDWNWAHSQDWQHEGSPWRDRARLSYLAEWLLLAIGSATGAVASMTVLPAMILIERGRLSLESGEFRVTDLIVNRGEPIPGADLVNEINRSAHV